MIGEKAVVIVNPKEHDIVTVYKPKPGQTCHLKQMREKGLEIQAIERKIHKAFRSFT